MCGYDSLRFRLLDVNLMIDNLRNIRGGFIRKIYFIGHVT